jgi:hypothetical protein
MEHDVPRDTHGIVQITLNLIEDIFGRATQKDGTCVRILALGEEGKVLVANLLDVEKTTLGADIRSLDVADIVDDCRTGSAGDAVVV